MKPALWMLAVALPLAAQPKLLTNAQGDTRSAAAGLDAQFHALLAMEPQPAWIGYSVPAARGNNLGCESGRMDGWGGSGVVHLESPDHAVILFRVEAKAVDRIRTISPDCAIDAGGVPVHWLSDVQPAQSIALLETFAPDREGEGRGAVSAIAIHAGPEADAALGRFVAPDQPEWLRQRAASSMGSARGRGGLDVLKSLIAADPSARVRQSAISALAASREPEATAILIAVARGDRIPRTRAVAIGALGRKSGPAALNAITEALENDADPQVRRRAVSALQSLPDGSGIPLLIRTARTAKDSEVRKQAMSSLQQSNDARALAFFEEVLNR